MNLEQDSVDQIQIKDNKIFAPLARTRTKWLNLTPEEKIRQEYVLILQRHYGFSFDQMEQEKSVSNLKRGTGQARADLVVWRSAKDKQEDKRPYIVVECKAQHAGIRKEDYFQGFDYASYIGAKFFVTTNLKETRFFKVNGDDHAAQFDEIVDIPNAQEILSEKVVLELLEKTKAFTSEEFSQLLFKCHNIIRNNDRLLPEAAFDEISKILLMKISYEREQPVSRSTLSTKHFEELKQVYAETRGPNDTQLYQKLFAQTKEFYADDNLFDKSESLRIRENSFLHIVKELEKYNLSNISNDVKGIAFEKFLGRTFRGELGQFFTPRTVVNYMVSVLDPEEGETVCDPCCGSGGFLTRTFDYVRDKIEHHIQQVKEQVKLDLLPTDIAKLSEAEQNARIADVNHTFAQLNKELDINNPDSRLRKLSYDSLFGTDVNHIMARTAKLNMIMHGDAYREIYHHDGLLNVNGIFDGRFDVVITNPPFGIKVEKSALITEDDLPTTEEVSKYVYRYGLNYELKAVAPLRGHLYQPILSLYETSEYSTFTEVLFLERALKLLRPGGRLGIVLPELVLNHAPLQHVRDFVEGRARLLNITSIPQDLFMASGATVKPFLVFLKKFTVAESDTYAAVLSEEEAATAIVYAEREQILKDAHNDALRGISKMQEKVLEKKYKEQLAKLEAQRVTDVRQAVKIRLNYLVPVVEVEKLYTNNENNVEEDLQALAAEFSAYRHKEQLWNNK